MKARPRSLGTFLLLSAGVVCWLYLLALPVALAAEAAVNPGAGPQVSGVQPGPPPPLTILFTGEVTGWTEPCG
ncbi:MAG: hypothetical protein L0Z52_12000 [Acidobacteria bacterium]|nr:hypothetical protein [Acidobacteriota bacterium]